MRILKYVIGRLIFVLPFFIAITSLSFGDLPFDLLYAVGALHYLFAVLIFMLLGLIGIEMLYTKFMRGSFKLDRMLEMTFPNLLLWGMSFLCLVAVVMSSTFNFEKWNNGISDVKNLDEKLSPGKVKEIRLNIKRSVSLAEEADDKKLLEFTNVSNRRFEVLIKKHNLEN